MIHILLLCLYLSTSFSEAKNISLDGWKLVKEFSQGMLFSHASIPKMTLTTWHEKQNFLILTKFDSKKYLEGLKFTREKSFSVGGLKNWNLIKIISEKKDKKFIELTFVGHYFRSNGEEVLLTEMHTFSDREFWQWQVVRDIKKSVPDNEYTSLFKKLSDEIIN